eukprot:7307791-Karenia_brevis.AAC.1
MMQAKAALVEQLETETRRYSRLAVRDGNPLPPPADGAPVKVLCLWVEKTPEEKEARKGKKGGGKGGAGDKGKGGKRGGRGGRGNKGGKGKGLSLIHISEPTRH